MDKRKLIILLVVYRFFQNCLGEESECQCVLPQFCGDHNAPVNGHGLLDPRMDRNPCPIYPQICCEFPMAEEINVQDFKSTGKCGISNVNLVEQRITQESTGARYGEFPWNLLIMEKGNSGNEKKLYRCGASLIHPKVAMTAAHCLTSSDPNYHQKLIVRAGEWNISYVNEENPIQENDVEQIVKHPHFNSLSLKNDIALLFLIEPFIMSENVGLVCLPSYATKIQDKNCIATGWGKDNFKVGSYSTVLRKVEMAIVQRDKCLYLLRNTRLGKMYNLHRSFICAGGKKNKDTCKGDGGGPLVCPLSGQELEQQFVQMGIVSWGIGCGNENVPGVYVNVALYAEWIDGELENRFLDTSFYKPS